MDILYDTGHRNTPVLEFIGLLQQGWAHTWLPEQGGLLGEGGWNDSKEELRRPAMGWILAWWGGGLFGNWVPQYSAQGGRSEAELDMISQSSHRSEKGRSSPFAILL